MEALDIPLAVLRKDIAAWLASRVWHGRTYRLVLTMATALNRLDDRICELQRPRAIQPTLHRVSMLAAFVAASAPVDSDHMDTLTKLTDAARAHWRATSRVAPPASWPTPAPSQRVRE